MKHITTKQFQILTDNDIVWDLLAENYAEKGTEANEVEAPFFEYAITSTWLDKRYLYLNRLWFDGDRAVGFVFYEAPCTEVHFCLRRGYEELADEMIEYAENDMRGNDKEKTLFFGPQQKALMEAAAKRGYRQSFVNENWVIDLGTEALDYPLPKGFHFVEPDQVDPV